MLSAMKTLSMDLRVRILATYDAGESTREEVAKRFRVSVAMVKKLLQLRRRTGQIGPRHHLCGRKPLILPAHREQLRALVTRKPDMTLAELRTALALRCTLPAIHYALAAMDLTYKKRHSMPPSRIGPTSPGRGAAGAGSKAASTRAGSSSSMSPPPRPT
jgi:transposase